MLHERSTVHTNNLSRNPAALGARDESHNLGDLGGSPEPVERRRTRDALDHGLRLALAEELSVSRARGHGVHGDALAAEVLGEHARQLLDGALGGGVEGVRGGHGAAARDARAHEDDAAPRRHVRRRGLRQEQGAAHVEREGGLEGALGGAGEVLQGHRPRVGDDHVHAAEARHGARDEVAHLRGAGGVGLDCEGGRPVGFWEGGEGCFRSGGVSAVVQDYACAGGADALRYG